MRCAVIFTTLVALSLQCRFLSICEAQAQPTRLPNIILVMPDDIGYGDYSCLGNPINKTPSVDAFWKQSVRFTDFHVSPTCAPTRSALMSGRHEFKNGVTHTIHERERMALSAITLAQVLKSAGYVNGVFGKWHLGDEASYQPDRRGFDEVYIHGGGGIGQTYPGSCGDAPDNHYANPALLHNGVFEKTKGYCTDLFFDQATRWIDQQRTGKTPFFAYITPNVAHGPLECPEENFQHYAGKVPENVAKFFGMIETLDINFGKLMRKLDEWQLANDTLVIFIGGDNGGTAGVSLFNGGRRAGKGTAFQGGTRAACFWRWPSRFQGNRDIAALTAHVDIFPTIADIIGFPLNDDLAKQVEGRSLLPLLLNPEAPWADRLLVTHLGRWERGHASESQWKDSSIRNARFTLVNNTQLYDLQSDTAETTNVIQSFPDEAARLRSAHDKWWSDIQPMLVNEDAVGPSVNPFKEIFWKQFGKSNP